MRKILACLAVLSALSVMGPAASEDAKYDTSGKGAVLCVQLMLMEVRYMAQLCQWQRTASDEAIDRAISDIDAFVIRNSSTPVTQQELDQRKLDYFAHRQTPGGVPPARCKADPAAFDSDTKFLWTLHQQAPEKLKAWIDDVLSIPREPLLNPCM